MTDKEEMQAFRLKSRATKTSVLLLFIYFFPFIFISWRLITLQYCSGFCHTLTWISHGFTCIPHPNTPSHLSLNPIPLGQGWNRSPAQAGCMRRVLRAGALGRPSLAFKTTVRCLNCCLILSHGPVAPAPSFDFLRGNRKEWLDLLWTEWPRD